MREKVKLHMLGFDWLPPCGSTVSGSDNKGTQSLIQSNRPSWSVRAFCPFLRAPDPGHAQGASGCLSCSLGLLGSAVPAFRPQLLCGATSGCENCGTTELATLILHFCHFQQRQSFVLLLLRDQITDCMARAEKGEWPECEGSSARYPSGVL